MSRLRQVFSGPEDLPDDGYESPWTYPAEVRIPMEHWEAIVAFARGRGAALLERAARLDGDRLDETDEARFLDLLDALAEAVVDAPPLTPEDSDPDEVPEPMPNTSHAGMLRDIARFVRRLRASGLSFDSWVD